MRYVASDLDLHCICITIKDAMLNAWAKSATKFLQGLNIIYFDFLIIRYIIMTNVQRGPRLHWL